MILQPHQALDGATAVVSLPDGGRGPARRSYCDGRMAVSGRPATRHEVQEGPHDIVLGADGLFHPNPINPDAARDIIAVLLERAWVAIVKRASRTTDVGRQRRSLLRPGQQVQSRLRTITL
jgi:hypothetical protein